MLAHIRESRHTGPLARHATQSLAHQTSGPSLTHLRLPSRNLLLLHCTASNGRSRFRVSRISDPQGTSDMEHQDARTQTSEHTPNMPQDMLASPAVVLIYVLSHTYLSSILLHATTQLSLHMAPRIIQPRTRLLRPATAPGTISIETGSARCVGLVNY